MRSNRFACFLATVNLEPRQQPSRDTTARVAGIRFAFFYDSSIL
jgi:hypothetical protein